MTDGLRDVRLLGFPLDVHQRATEHHEELMREFRLLTLDTPSAADVPKRLVDLIAELTQAYGGVSQVADAERDAALARGDATVDLTYTVPAGAAEACRRLDVMLDEADEFCRGDRLLTLATPPESLAFRKWYLGEFVAQLDGAAPTPWAAYAVSATQR